MSKSLVVLVLATLGCAPAPSLDRPAAAPTAARAPGLSVAHTWGGLPPDGPWRIDDATAVAIAPHGRWVIVASLFSMGLFALPSGRPLAALPALSQVFGPPQIAVSPDGEHVGFFDLDRRCVAVWSIQPARERACMPVQRIGHIAFSPDGAALVIADDQHLLRASVAQLGTSWDTPIAAVADHGWVAWPTPDVILVGEPAAGRVAGRLTAYAADTGAQRWRNTSSTRYLGMDRGDAVVLGTFYDNKVLGSLAHLDLGSGALRDITAPNEHPEGGLVFDDGTVVLSDSMSSAHYYRIGAPAQGHVPLPPETRALAATPDGRLAVVASRDGVALWDLRAARPIDTGDQQRGPIVALDATRDVVISASRDGALIVRTPDGRFVARRRATAPACRRWAIHAPSRRAACIAEISQPWINRQMAPPMLEWIELDRDRRGSIEIGADPIALGRRTLWMFDTYRTVAFDLQAHLGEHLPRLGQDVGFEIGVDVHPRFARGVADDGVAFGGAEHYTSPHGETESWEGKGLWVLSHTGALTQLDANAIAIGIDADRSGRRLAVAVAGGLELWALDDAHAAWTRRWSRELPDPGDRVDEHPDTQARIAISDDGALIAASKQNGQHLALYDAATGRPLANLEVGSDARSVTALAFGGDALYAGMSNGQVLALQLRR